MSILKRLKLGTAASPVMAAAIYGALLLVLLASTAFSIKGLWDRYLAVENLRDVSARLVGRGPAGARRNGEPAGEGSYFLEGPTITVAGAALLQRVVTAITQQGGTVLSSQVDMSGPQPKEGFIAANVNYEVEQASLQKIIYDLEAGLPFLFIEQLEVQSPGRAANPGSSTLRVVMGVSGQWKAVQ
jgi:general secretion pathway protein M